MPHIATNLTPLTFAVDIQGRTAAIPGATGEETITFTYTKDLAKFVVAAMGVDSWPEAFHCYSDYATWNELVNIAEEVTGKPSIPNMPHFPLPLPPNLTPANPFSPSFPPDTTFTVIFDPPSKLRDGKVTELPSHPHLYPYFPFEMLQELLSKFGLWAINGDMYVPREGALNARFPEISTASVREIVGAWKGK